MSERKPSIVEYYSRRNSSCAYCGSRSGSYTYGLDAYTLKVEDYQNMIDRGWRRSGEYCYKAIMDITCCPYYTIRCAATDFKLSKTQKKIIKKVNNFLINGTFNKDIKEAIVNKTEIAQPMEIYNLNKGNENANNVSEIKARYLSTDLPVNDKFVEESALDEKNKSNNLIDSVKTDVSSSKKKVKEKSMKAKYLRIERKRQKLEKLGFSEEEIKKKLVEKKKYPVIKTVEDYLNEPLSKSPVHNLKITLVRSCPPSEEFNRTFVDSFNLYKRYQVSVHKDHPELVTESQFENFLVTSPLQASSRYGSFHQQYWLDDKLIAVGVIDILPKCVSSVYFFHDPDYRALSFGTYGALREIEFTRKLSRCLPDLTYYYMGFYIHSCIKMKYKAAFKPSHLLCPELFTWHPIERCISKINVSKYSRFNEDALAKDANSVVSASEVFILYRESEIPFNIYLNLVRNNIKEKEQIEEFAKLIGKLCAKNMLLVRY